MFEDERINLLRGKCFRSSIIIGTTISIIYLLLKVIFNRSFNIISELFIILAGILVLLYGELRMLKQEKDERYYADKYTFYIKGAKIYLIIGMIGFAAAVPFELYFSNSRIPMNYLLVTLEVMGIIYFSYYFKKNKICFNYSFLENDSKGYYKEVFKRIGKLCIALFLIYLAAFTIGIFFFIQRNISVYSITLLLAFICSSFSLSIEYLFLSFLERVSYKEKGDRAFSPSIFISGIIYFFLCLLICYFNVRIYFIDKGAIAPGIPPGQLIARYNTYISNVKTFSEILLGIMLSYVLYLVGNKKICIIGITISIYMILIRYISKVYYVEIFNFFNGNIALIETFLFGYYLYLSVLDIAFFIGIILLMIGIIREKRISKYSILIPILLLIAIILRNVNLYVIKSNLFQIIILIGYTLLVLFEILILCFVKEIDEIEE